MTRLEIVLGVLVVALAAELVRRARRRPPPTARRILFPLSSGTLAQPVLDATLRLARAERATLVPAFLARVPLILPLDAALPRQVDAALPLLEEIEQQALRCGVAVDARIERGRTTRHALRELFAHEPYDRIVVAAGDGFGAPDVAWLLEHAAGEILVLRPATPSASGAGCR